MILVRHIHWRLMALPTPLLVLLVTAGPAPFILLIEGGKRAYRLLLRWRCRRLLRRQSRPLFIYTRRVDSADLLEKTVLPALDVTPVVVEKMRIVDKQFKVVSVLLPVQLGFAFPVLVHVSDDQICVESLHQHIYTETLHVRDPQMIIESCKDLLAKGQ